MLVLMMIILVKMIMMMMVIFMKIWPPGAVRGPQGPQEGLLGPKWALRKSMDCSIDFAVCLESRICILVLGSTASWPCSIIYYLDFTFFFFACIHLHCAHLALLAAYGRALPSILHRNNVFYISPAANCDY